MEQDQPQVTLQPLLLLFHQDSVVMDALFGFSLEAHNQQILKLSHIGINVIIIVAVIFLCFVCLFDVVEL